MPINQAIQTCCSICTTSLSSKEKKYILTWKADLNIPSQNLIGSHKLACCLPYQARGIIFSSNFTYLLDHILQMGISILFLKFFARKLFICSIRCFTLFCYSIKINSSLSSKMNHLKNCIFSFLTQTPFNLLRKKPLSLALSIK